MKTANFSRLSRWPKSVLLPALLSMMTAGVTLEAAGPVVTALEPALLGVSVRELGATGDGVTDDTDAIEAAVAAAREQNGVVFFPVGEYLVSRTIYLYSRMTVTGAQGAILKKIPAITQKFTKPVAKGDTVVYVDDASVYKVNQDFYLFDGNGSGANGTVGRIVAIDPAENKITFTVYGYEGAMNSYKVTKFSVFSNTFPILATNAQVEATDGLVIEGMTFDCQRQPDEPNSYTLAPIQMDAQTGGGGDQRNMVIRNNTILNSGSDGISVQSRENITIENNRVYNCAVFGIHVGTTINKMTIRNNYVENCGSAALFWCYGINEIIVTNNVFKGNQAGCTGIDGAGANSVIAFNTFDGTKTVGINMTGNNGGRTVITGNQFMNGQGTDISVAGSSYCVISNNIFSNGKDMAISQRTSDRITIVDNQFNNYTGDYVIRFWKGPKTKFTRDFAKLSRVSGNMVVGGKVAAISMEDSQQIILSENLVVPLEGGKAIEIADSCSEILVKNNIAEGEVVDLATSAR